MSMIKIEHLCKEYSDVTPLKDVCAEINKGDVISVIGPSGVGKSTLLRCINRLEEPTSGTVSVDGEIITDPGCDIYRIRRKMGMVFQSFNLFHNLNIIDNLTAAPMDILKIPRDQAYREGMELLERVGLADKAECFPEELSGGQQQRAAIARAIAMKPEIILFDEPTSALDPAMAGEVLSVIRDLASEGMTMLIVTHEMKFARDVSDRIFYMDEGIIYEEGTPDQIFDRPGKKKTREFIKRLKTTSIVIDEPGPDFHDIIRQLENYGKDAMLSPGELRYVTLTFEEMVMQNILGFLEDRGQGYPVITEIEHSEIDQRAVMEISYGGGRYDPLTEGDELSVMIVKRICSDIGYAYDEYEGKNKITAVI